MEDELVLVVDDNSANLRLVSFLLESTGYTVRTATDAHEAMAAVEKELPRLILMDIQLPGMDGLTLTRKLRADARTRDIVIVALTAYAMKGDQEKAIEAGCNDYITKPIDTRSLPERIRRHMANTHSKGGHR